jgi:ATP-dependent Clp protease ATP-binding subunit ClpB
VEIQLKNVNQRLKEQGIDIELSQEAEDELTQVGYDPVFGARPLKRAIQTYILNPLAQKILAGEFEKGKKVIVDWNGSEFGFRSS